MTAQELRELVQRLGSYNALVVVRIVRADGVNVLMAAAASVTIESVYSGDHLQSGGSDQRLVIEAFEPKPPSPCCCCRDR